jgi:hypothetical protein
LVIRATRFETAITVTPKRCILLFALTR